jgi:PKHD-type hydroxylase
MPPFLALPQVLTPDECGVLTALAAASPLRDAALAGGATRHGLRRADVVWLDDLAGSGWVMDRLVQTVARANREGFGFDLTEFAESAQVARYDAAREAHFDWHSDIGGAGLAARRKLTAVLQLTPPGDYAGGQLDLRPDSHIHGAPVEQGTAVVFPSFVLHRVTPVSAGIRWSLTLWAHGPAFR